MKKIVLISPTHPLYHLIDHQLQDLDASEQSHIVRQPQNLHLQSFETQFNMTHVHVISIKVGAGDKIQIAIFRQLKLLSTQPADVTSDLFWVSTSVYPKIMTDEIVAVSTRKL